MLRTKHYSWFAVAAALAACGGGEPADERAGERGDGTPSASADARESATAGAEGSVSFRVDGELIELDFLPSDANLYMKVVSTVVAKRGPGEPEQLTVSFVSTDLRAHDIPGEFPPAGAGSSIQTAMQSVGFSYTDPTGKEWAGPGRVHVESFDDDGVLTATFNDVTLPHTDKELPDITLTDGRIRATL